MTAVDDALFTEFVLFEHIENLKKTAKNSRFTLNLVEPEPSLPVSFSVLSSL